MNKIPLNDCAVRITLKERQGSLSQKEFAVQIGVSASYLSDLYNSRRTPGPKILKFLGIRKMDTFNIIKYERDVNAGT